MKKRNEGGKRPRLNWEVQLPPRRRRFFSVSLQIPNPSLSRPHPRQRVADRPEKHHARANPRALEEGRGRGAHGCRVLGRGRAAAPLFRRRQRRGQADWERRQHAVSLFFSEGTGGASVRVGGLAERVPEKRCSTRFRGAGPFHLEKLASTRKWKARKVFESERIGEKERIEEEKRRKNDSSFVLHTLSLSTPPPLPQAPLPASLLRCSSVLITSMTDRCGLW